MNENNQQNPVIPNVIIVDDIPSNLKILGDILEREGYMVRPVLSGKLALQVAEIEKPDLILLDIMMPEMDGYEVCHEFKERKSLRDIPIIFISALTDTNDIVKALKSGGVDYISKPFRAEEVLARVNTHMKLHQQRKQLEELNADKDRFFSIIAHDLRSPFNSFLGLTRMLVEDLHTLDKEEIYEIAMVMRNSAAGVYGLLENLLEWASIQRGLCSFDPRHLLLLSFLEFTMQPVMEFANAKQIDIAFEMPEDLKAYADANMLGSIVRNLVSNAVKFTPKGGTISVSARENGDDSVLISVSDSGIGMSSSMVDHLLQFDTQTGRKGTDGESSSGLGLTICKDFIEKHGGKFWVESKEGKGSSFHMIIPAALEVHSFNLH